MNYRKIGIPLCAIFALLFCFAPSLWPINDVLVNGVTKHFVYRTPITIQDAQVQGGPHNSFPMMFNSTTNAALQADLKTVANGGKVRSSSGYDIVFATADNTEILKHEIEKYTASSGEYIAWVKVNLTGSDQTIYIYYSSTEISADTQHVTDVWDSNFKGVWHLKEDASGVTPILTLRPNAAGDLTQLTQNPTGGSNYDKVDDVTPDDFSTYVYTFSYTSYQTDLYNIPNHTTETAAIQSVTVYFRVASQSATPSRGKASIKTYGNQYDGTEVYWGSGGDGNYYTKSYTWTVNPNTSAAWTWSEIDALQAGVTLKNDYAASGCNCTQLYVEVECPVYSDSTSNSNHGSDYMSATDKTGKVGSGQEFDGTDDKVVVQNSSSLNIVTALTAEAWIKSSDGGGGIASKLSTEGSYYGYIFAMGDNSGSGKISYFGDYSQGYGWSTSSSTVNDNSWHHIAVVHSGTMAYFYKDGVADGTATVGSRTSNSTEDFWIGIDNTGCTSYLTGILDEIRVSNTARSADWIKTEYNNQNSPSTFYTVGSPTLVELSSFTAKGMNGTVLLEWKTKSELDNEGFNVLRSWGGEEEYVRINSYLIPATGTFIYGAEYSYIDSDVENGVTYFYLLEDVDLYGQRTRHGPVSATPNDIELLSPADGEKVSAEACLFSWRSGAYSLFKVDISSSEAFPESGTLSFPQNGWTDDQYMLVQPEVLERFISQGGTNSNYLFWRVRALGVEGETVSSAPRRMLLAAGEAPRIEERQELRKTQKKAAVRKKF